ncbi:hypothetical protein [Fibrella aestuarina]|nr:hypothetical protein [Fibrella aestuarina]
MVFRLNVALLLCLSWPVATPAATPPGIGFKKLVAAGYVSRRPTYPAAQPGLRSVKSPQRNRLSLLRPLGLLR